MLTATKPGRLFNEKRVFELKPIRLTLEDFEELEKQIKAAFREILYVPIMKDLEISPSVMMNARASPLAEALRSGKIRYELGAFRGRFSAAVSKELKRLGAKWDPKARSFRIPRGELPAYINLAIVQSETSHAERLAKVQTTLSQILPEKISGLIDSVSIFKKIIVKTDRDIAKSLKAITIPPKITDTAAERIAKEWSQNLDLYIKDFTDSEILNLRKSVQKNFEAGNRFETLIHSIQRSYGVTERKAHFLARQETNLLISKFKETRYTEAGVTHYRWRCVVGSPAHPVRPSHKALDGKIFRWDDPPITTADGEPVRRNNPGQDYNCRCMAVPVLNPK